MTDTMNHAEVIREALEHFKENAFDGYGYEMPGPAGKALDALTREAEALEGRNASLRNQMELAVADREDYIKQVVQRDATIAAQAERIATLVEALMAAEVGLTAVEDLINNSDGVTGLHLNGDVAEWNDLLDGAFCEWLEPFSVALSKASAALAPSKGER